MFSMFRTGIKAVLLFLFLSSGSLAPHAQVDFDNYRSLQSQGAMPDDFYLNPGNKLEREIKWGIKSENGEKKEILDLYDNLMVLLQSGKVVYGDELSAYAKSVAQRLLADDPALFARLRFYTLKENTAAAFSTRDGMIFISTGLISQLSNEAELAFLLGREIAHIKKEHARDIFRWRYSNPEFRVSEYEVYGTEIEKEADNDAIELLHRAGYSQEGILSAFTVLIYSYIPFNDIPLDFNFFYANTIHFPAYKTAIRPVPITSYDQLNGVISPYYSLKKRSDGCDAQIALHSNWGKALFLVANETTFKQLSKIGKYESVSMDINRHAYTNALYSVYLLQKEDPNAYYLRKMKLLALLGAWNYANEGKKYLAQKSQPEGEIGVLTEFLKKSNEKELTILCLYSLRDFYQTSATFPDKEYILGFASRKLKANSKLFGSYYAESKERVFEKQLQEKDSVTKAKNLNSTGTPSKYDKIREKRSQQENANFTNLSDTTDYHFFNHKDLLGDSAFIQQILALNRTEPEAITGIPTDSTRCIFLRCDYSSINQPETTRIQLQKNFRESCNAALQQVHYQQVDLMIPGIQSDKNTEKFNERAAILVFLKQEKDLIGSSLPFNYNILAEIARKYQTTKLVFAVQYGDERRSVDCLVLNLLTGEVYSAEEEKFPYPPSKQQVVKALAQFLTNPKKMNVETASQPLVLENVK